MRFWAAKCLKIQALRFLFHRVLYKAQTLLNTIVYEKTIKHIKTFPQRHPVLSRSCLTFIPLYSFLSIGAFIIPHRPSSHCEREKGSNICKPTKDILYAFDRSNHFYLFKFPKTRLLWKSSSLSSSQNNLKDILPKDISNPYHLYCVVSRRSELLSSPSSGFLSKHKHS